MSYHQPQNPITTTKKARPGPCRRAAIRRRRQQETQQQQWEEAENWPQEEHEWNHCHTCHYQYQGTWHHCTKFPGLDQDTCPACQWQYTDPIDAHPLLALIDTTFEWYLNQVIKFTKEFEYASLWQKYLVYFGTLYIVALALVK